MDMLPEDILFLTTATTTTLSPPPPPPLDCTCLLSRCYSEPTTFAGVCWRPTSWQCCCCCCWLPWNHCRLVMQSTTTSTDCVVFYSQDWRWSSLLRINASTTTHEHLTSQTPIFRIRGVLVHDNALYKLTFYLLTYLLSFNSPLFKSNRRQSDGLKWFASVLFTSRTVAIRQKYIRDLIQGWTWEIHISATFPLNFIEDQKLQNFGPIFNTSHNFYRRGGKGGQLCRNLA